MISSSKLPDHNSKINQYVHLILVSCVMWASSMDDNINSLVRLAVATRCFKTLLSRVKWDFGAKWKFLFADLRKHMDKLNHHQKIGVK